MPGDTIAREVLRTFETEKGSIVRIFHPLGWAWEIDWDWAEEEGCCVDCKPYFNLDEMAIIVNCEDEDCGHKTIKVKEMGF